MEKKAAKPVAKRAVKPQGKVGNSGSSIAIATALVMHWPKDAEQIIKVMAEASTSRSMQRKLARVQQAFDSLQKGGQQ
jgi:hypothetical protein